MAPIATVTETAMQQDHRRTRSVGGIPDPSFLVFDVTMFGWIRQRWGAARFERNQVVIIDFHLISID
jgi:hypothetical protein